MSSYITVIPGIKTLLLFRVKASFIHQRRRYLSQHVSTQKREITILNLNIKRITFPNMFQPCAEAIFRKPTHRKNRNARDVGGDTDALLDNETISQPPFCSLLAPFDQKITFDNQKQNITLSILIGILPKSYTISNLGLFLMQQAYFSSFLWKDVLSCVQNRQIFY